MADSRSKRSRRKRKAKAAAYAEEEPFSADSSVSSNAEALEESLFWYNGGSDEKSQTLAALRLEVLGPFLFSRAVLCDQALTLSRSKELLPSNNVVWPRVFDRSMWTDVRALVQVMAAVQSACVADDSVFQSLIAGEASLLGMVSLVKCLKDHSHTVLLEKLSDEQIYYYYSIIEAQGRDFGSRASGHGNLAGSFLLSLTDKLKLVDPVKDRGNSNFKQQHFKAAIADYSMAIKLCAFSPVLYCNRALCYLRNEEYWPACIDSYRALFLHPTWEKPYYRCAEAWHSLGELSHAEEINRQGQIHCSSIVKLHDQLNRFMRLTGHRSPCHANPYKEASYPYKEASYGSTRDVPQNNICKISSAKAVRKKTAATAVKDQVSQLSKCLESMSQPKTPLSDYTKLEQLHCPEVDARLSCAHLRRLCNQVKLEWCSPAAYFSDTGSKWEELEPDWLEPTPPTTNPLADHEPLLAKFDEIWCPDIVDCPESD